MDRLPKIRQQPKTPDPADIRRVFADNLRQLLESGITISRTCREIGVHRSQFNRYLNGEAFPKPDVLHRICTLFETDARILLQPLSTFSSRPRARTAKTPIIIHPEVKDFFSLRSTEQETSILPCGFYRYVRKSYIEAGVYQTGLVYIYMADGLKFFRGLIAREEARRLNVRVNSAADREFRGSVLGTDTGVLFWAARRGSKSMTLTYLERRTTVHNTFLYGFIARTMAQPDNNPPVANFILEPLPDDWSHLLHTARRSGFLDPEELPSVYRDMLDS